MDRVPVKKNLTIGQDW